METLKIKRGDTFYLLFNLSEERVRELKSDAQQLKKYSDECLYYGVNICVLNDEEKSKTISQTKNSNAPMPSTSQSKASSASNERKKFSFLCERFGHDKCVYAVKFGSHQWHYFDLLDSLVSEHDVLLPLIDDLIGRLDLCKVKSIDINLNEEQSEIYYTNNQFHFKNKMLKTHMNLVQFENQPTTSAPESNSKTRDSLTSKLVFASGETNPLLFIHQFEKCRDTKTDKEKMYKIREFVDECHKAEFSKLYFTTDWPTVKAAFLKMYSLPFVRNKKREMNIDFNEATSLRSFVERKLISLSKFTTLSLMNQMEIVMNDLPEEISSLFITNEKMTSDKSEILDFCDTIEDIATTFLKPTHEIETFVRTTDENTNDFDTQSSPMNRMEVFEFTRNSESQSELSDYQPRSSRGQGRGRGRGRPRGRGRGETGGIKKRGRPRKMNSIPEDVEMSDYGFLNQMDDTSRSTWSDC